MLRYLLGALSLIIPALVWSDCGTTTPMPSTVLTMLHINQWGYLPTAQKVAVLADPQTGYNSVEQYTPPATLDVRRSSDNTAVLTLTPTVWSGGATHTQSGDKAWWLDLSALTTTGEYYLYDAGRNARSDLFQVHANPYRDVFRQAQRMFYYQRSGLAKTTALAGANWADGASFLGTGQDTTARSVTDQTNAATEKDLRGGWYDAGDYNKYSVWAAYTLLDLLHAYLEHPTMFGDDLNIPESGNSIPDILDEAKWELDFLLRMQQTGGAAAGSVLSKVSSLGFAHTSPPSADLNARYYGAASTASTACVGAAFALGAKVFSGITGMSTYATTLQTASVNAYTWASSNPSVSYDNTGFASANPEPNTYGRDMCRLMHAIYLYAQTAGSTYKTYVEANYTASEPIASSYWNYFRPNSYVGHALLYYSIQAGITAGVKTNIESKKTTSSQRSDMLGAVTNGNDAYRAPINTGEYVWGSNEVKSHAANLFLDMNRYNLDSANATAYRNAAAGYVHYLLGINPNSIAYFTNLYAYGCKRCVNETWHSWYTNGSVWQNAITSSKGPAPGYLVGGPNEYYGGPPGQVPPRSQPPQKAWLDSNFDYDVGTNTSYPIWEITEPGIYYQGALLHALAAFVTAP